MATDRFGPNSGNSHFSQPHFPQQRPSPEAGGSVLGRGTNTPDALEDDSRSNQTAPIFPKGALDRILNNFGSPTPTPQPRKPLDSPPPGQPGDDPDFPPKLGDGKPD